MVRRPLLVALGTTLALGVAALLPGQGAGAAPPAATSALQGVSVVDDLTFTVRTGPATAPMTCTIDGDLYLPATASPTNRVPAILTTNGFGGSKDDQAGLGRAFAARGYAVLSYTGLGFPNSGCKIMLDDPLYDGLAASALVSFLGGDSTLGGRGTVTRAGAAYPAPQVVKRDPYAHDGRPRAHDPRVGMIGGSYGGQIQFAVAAVDPRVDTLVPLITWNDLRYSLAPNNTAFSRGVTSPVPGTHKIGWSSLFFGVGIADGVQGAAIDPSRNVGCPNFRTEACEAKATLDTLGYPTQRTFDLTDQVSVAHYLPKVTVPTLLVQGQNDTLFNLQEAVATYRGLKAQGTVTKMVWQSWGHSGGGTPAPGELDLSGGDIEGTALGKRFSDWFAYWLKGDRTVTTGPEFSWFRDWVSYTGSAAPAYASSSSYPAGSAQTLRLSGGGTTGALTRGSAQPGTTSWANLPGGVPSSYTEVAALQGAVVPDGVTPPYDTPGTFGAWTSAPLTAPAELVGVPRLSVRFDSPVVAATQSAGPAGQLLVFAKLYDVAPDGTRTLVHRLISPTRVPDVTKPVTIELPGIVHQVPAGHRLQLVLAGSDAAYKNALASQPVSVTVDPLRPPTLTLQVTAPVR